MAKLKPITQCTECGNIYEVDSKLPLAFIKLRERNKKLEAVVEAAKDYVRCRKNNPPFGNRQSFNNLCLKLDALKESNDEHCKR